MKIDACLCDRCGTLTLSRDIQRTAHVFQIGHGTKHRVVDHTDLELCPPCADIFNNLLKQFLENK